MLANDPHQLKRSDMLAAAIEWHQRLERVPYWEGEPLEGTRNHYSAPNVCVSPDGNHLASVRRMYALGPAAVKAALDDLVISFRQLVTDRRLVATDFAPLPHPKWEWVTYHPALLDGIPVRFQLGYSLQEQAWLLACDAHLK